jgi:hypothetical protein
MAFDRKISKQYFKFIEQAGYLYSKDNLGYYFDNGMKRFSIMKTGPSFQCFYNKKSGQGFVLKAKSTNFIDFNHCLQWVLTNIQKGD